MDAGEFLQFVNRMLFVLVFVSVLVEAIRRRRRTHINAAFFFGAAAAVILASWAFQLLGVEQPAPLRSGFAALVMALPYLLLRLVAGFTHVPRAVMRAAELGLAAIVVSLFVASSPLPTLLLEAYVAYFVIVQLYAAVVVVRAARRAAGITRRRLWLVATGSGFLGLTILVAGLRAVFPGLQPVWDVLSAAATFGAGLSYFLGLAPPAWLRQAWQGPELRAFLENSARLPRIQDTDVVMTEIARTAAATLGTANAGIGLYDEQTDRLRFIRATGERGEIPTSEFVAGRVFTSGRPQFVADAPAAFPERANVYRQLGVVSVLSAPIIAGARRLGVLSVLSAHEPVFADDDLALIQLLANQAAVVLESRALLEEAARVRAEAEATRLKEDFLSSAAHDLRSPLTTLVGQAQLLERRMERMTDVPATFVRDVGRIVGEGQRLRRLVLELLDAARAEQGGLVGPREATVDLAALTRETAARHTSERHPVTVHAEEPVFGAFDAVRTTQLVDNLIENAVKYTPEGGPICVRVWQADDLAHIEVVDRGIGIPKRDLPHLFDRFRRGGNVDDRRFAGMGLGLYICRAIVEGHGGRIWADSDERGSTFRVEMPLDGAAKRQ